MKILIATGGSEYSFMAVEKACQMLRIPDNGEIRIISVYRSLVESTPEPLEISEDQIASLENIEKARATEIAFRAADIISTHFPEKSFKVSMTAEKGDPRKKILKEAENWGADLIVVGSLGHNFLSRLLIGSVSDAVVKNAKCSVLVVRGEVNAKA